MRKDFTEEQAEPLYRIAWLAGVFDSGSSFFVGQAKVSWGEHVRLMVAIEISSLNPHLLREVADILREHSIGFTTRKTPEIKEGRQKRAAADSLHLQNKEEILNFLFLITPFLVVKREKAKAVLLYLERAALVPKYRPTEEDLRLLSPFFGKPLIRKENA